MIRTEGFVHFTIPVKDLDMSEKFYMDILGVRKLRRNSHMVFLEAHGLNFILTYSENPVDPNVDDKHDIHTAFRVSPEGYDDAKKFLAGKGIRIFKEENRESGTFHGRSAYFHDPDRNVIEIIDLRRGPVAEGQ